MNERRSRRKVGTRVRQICEKYLGKGKDVYFAYFGSGENV